MRKNSEECFFGLYIDNICKCTYHLREWSVSSDESLEELIVLQKLKIININYIPIYHIEFSRYRGH